MFNFSSDTSQISTPDHVVALQGLWLPLSIIILPYFSGKVYLQFHLTREEEYFLEKIAVCR
jgi:hypothetical protein